jgi:hypothetical protein
VASRPNRYCSRYARPVRNPVLSSYFTDLTGITQQMINAQGTDFSTAFHDFVDFVGAASAIVIPFGVTGVPLRPIMHACGLIGSDIPTWDIRDGFGETNHLVVNMEQGRDFGALSRRPAGCTHEAGLVRKARRGCVPSRCSRRRS